MLGTASWASAGGDRLVVSFTSKRPLVTWASWTLDTGTLTPIAPDLQPMTGWRRSPSEAVLVAGQAARPTR